MSSNIFRLVARFVFDTLLNINTQKRSSIEKYFNSRFWKVLYIASYFCFRVLLIESAKSSMFHDNLFDVHIFQNTYTCGILKFSEDGQLNIVTKDVEIRANF